MRAYFTKFSPERWLKFPNQFKEISLLWKKIGWISIPVGVSNLGMCGGVASTALDIFYSNRLPPSRIDPPSSREDKTLFDWLKKRQVESITFRDFCKYFTHMFTTRKTDRIETKKEWEKIKKHLCGGNPVVIGLERAKVEALYKIYQITNIVKNHQVIVWGFEENSEEATLYIYDPSKPDMKDIKITLHLTADNSIEWSPREIGPIYAFFKTSYTPKQPPWK